MIRYLALARRGLAVTALCALSLTWGTAGPAKAQATSALIPITIGYQVDAEAAFFMAKESGAFQKAGLAPTFKQFLSGPAELAALANDNIDIGEFGITPYVAGLAHTSKMVAIMVGDDVTKSNSLVVRPGSSITSFTDLRGKRVTAVKGSGSYFGLLTGLDKYHMSLNDIQYLNLSPAVMMPTFAHGEVDAAWIWAPWVQKLEGMGGKVLLACGDVGALVPDFWVANRPWLATHNDAAARYVKVISEQTELIHQDPQNAVKPIQDVMGISPDQAKKIVRSERYSTIKQLMDPSYALTLVDFESGKQGTGKAIRMMAEFEKAHGMIETVPPLSSAFAFGPIKAAMAMQ